MAEITDDVTTEAIDDKVEIVLINPQTDLPYDVNEEPIIIPMSEFRILEKEAAAKGMTFEEFFVYIIKLALENSAKEFTKANFELDKFED